MKRGNQGMRKAEAVAPEKHGNAYKQAARNQQHEGKLLHFVHIKQSKSANQKACNQNGHGQKADSVFFHTYYLLACVFVLLYHGITWRYSAFCILRGDLLCIPPIKPARADGAGGREREKIYNPKLEYVGFYYDTMI
ncbi:MAG: hypothetical protein V8Q85_03980 [Christensenellales bacterium]